MNNETKLFVEDLLFKYDASNFPVKDMDNTIQCIGVIGGRKLELSSYDAINVIKELCEALNILDEE
jgi:hypothetical protein